jgi:hypothetical protein
MPRASSAPAKKQSARIRPVITISGNDLASFDHASYLILADLALKHTPNGVGSVDQLHPALQVPPYQA